jgi:hypothetical protein
MRMRRLGLLAMTLAATMAMAPDLRAQEGPGGLINPQRDCQTIRTCNFRKGGSYRGCLSSYSCRACRFVRVPCKGLRGGTCQRLRCGWGGVS